MPKFLFGLVGERGAGKTLLAELLRFELKSCGHTTTFFKFSDVLLQTLNLWGIEKTTINLQKLGRAMRDAYGISAIPDAMEAKVRACTDVVILDGVRWSGDVDLVRKFSPCALVYITASETIRFQRTTARSEKQEEQVGTGMSWDEFKAAELAENERNIPSIGLAADYAIVNEHLTRAEISAKVQKILAETVLKVTT